MTKEQERDALKRIMKIVDGLPEDSYVKKAAEGLEEIAGNNIEGDFLESWKERCLYHMEEGSKRERDLKKAAEAAEAKADNYANDINYWKAKYEALENRNEELGEMYAERGVAWSEMLTERNAARDAVKALQADIMELKAKLYDMITATA